MEKATWCLSWVLIFIAYLLSFFLGHVFWLIVSSSTWLGICKYREGCIVVWWTVCSRLASSLAYFWLPGANFHSGFSWINSRSTRSRRRDVSPWHGNAKVNWLTTTKKKENIKKIMNLRRKQESWWAERRCDQCKHMTSTRQLCWWVWCATVKKPC